MVSTTLKELALQLTGLAVGFGLTVALTPLIIRVAERRHWLDQPDGERRLHARAVPRLGGVGIFAATCVAGLAFLASSWLSDSVQIAYLRVLPGIAIGATIIFFTGLLDDLRGLSPQEKLVAQGLAAAVVMAFGLRVELLAIAPEAAVLSLGVLAIPVTLLWIVGMTNAFNLIDGVDGLAGTVALVAIGSAIGVDFFLHGHQPILMLFPLLGAVFGFLRFNNSPARIFLGDSGSMTLGFILAVHLLLSSTDERGALFFLVPLCALAFPLLDTFIAITRRWLRGEPFSRADGRHIHHQLLALGLSARKTVNLLGMFFAGVAALGISVTFAPPQLTFALLLGASTIAFVSIFYGARWLRYGEFAELGASVASVVRNARTVVREKIRTNEIADRIRTAENLDEVKEALSSLVDEVRVLDVELIAGDIRMHGPERQQISPKDNIPVRLDYPFAWETEAGFREVILRLWSARPGVGGSGASMRVATRIGPALEEWFQAHAEEANPVFFKDSASEPRRTQRSE